ncbi:MAG: IMP dehydrogenase, partial [Elusimicrobiota bacterium]|nr:IMP dehydrogenase [Elusimicrobiota bacterium]
LDTKNENLNGIILSKHLKICIDIANGYSQKFAKYVSSIRELFPENVIMAGNVCTTEMTQELILSGADIIKCGIGPGCFIAGTLIKTILGLKSIENINLNDYALTHKGHYKKVIKLFNRKTKKLIQINNFKSTENHEYYVINKEDKKKITEQNISQYAYWISAKDLIKEKHLLVKITK